MSRATRLGTTLVSAIALALLVSSAHAQVVVNPNPGVTGRPAIQDYQPRSGPPGTRVIVRGTGFTPYTQIVIGDQPVGTYQITGNQLEFVVPPEGWNGEIRLRHPGVPDFQVGRFQMTRNAYFLSDFQPRGGAAGTTVELYGSGFEPGDRVIFNGRDLSIMKISGKRIAVVVPPGAQTDYFTILRPNGVQVHSPRPFFVSQGNWMPTVGGFYPQDAKVGDRVTIVGGGFYSDAQVYVGGQAARVLYLTPSSIDFVVPRTQDGVITVRFPGLGDVNVGRLRLGWDGPRPPAPGPMFHVTGFQPRTGAPGTRVEIFGHGFEMSDRVFFGQQQLVVYERTSNRLLAVLPNNAHGVGEFVIVKQNGMRAASTEQFTVQFGYPGPTPGPGPGPGPAPYPDPTEPPIITSIDPEYGPPGTLVVIRGSRFGREPQVFYGGMEMQVTRRDRGEIEAYIPAQARRSEYIVVRGRRGEARSPQPFRIARQAELRFQPASGPAGRPVSLTGLAWAQGDQITLSGQAVRVLYLDATRVDVEIPFGARSGPFAVYRNGRLIAQSRDQFQVMGHAPGPGPGPGPGYGMPRLDSFVPNGGPPGTRVVLQGDNLRDATVSYGNAPMTVVDRRDRRIEVIIPEGARRPQHLVVTTPAGTVQTAQVFQLTGYRPGPDPAPGYPVEMSHFAPKASKPGHEVKIFGRGFTPNARVFYGNIPCRITRLSADEIRFEVPFNAVGQDYLTVEDGGQRLRTNEMLRLKGN